VRVVLLDLSDSVTRVRSTWPSWVRTTLDREARAAAEEGAAFAVLAFAQEVVRWYGPAEPADFSFDERWFALAPERRGSTDLASALLAAERLASAEGRAAQVRILGDGSYTGADPSAALARVHAQLVGAPPPDRPDPRLVAFEAARELEPDAPLVARLEWERGGLAADRPLAARVRGLPALDRTFELPPSANGSARLELGSLGSRHLALEVELVASEDAVPENNRASVQVRARGALQVELASSAACAGAARTLAKAWSANEGLGVSVRVWDQVHALAPETDLLVTLDLDPRAVDVAALAPFLARGGGWLAAGGGALLAGLDARSADSAARFLPCEPAEDDGPRDVLLLIDVSGSMDGPGFDALRNAAIALVERLRREDRLTLHFFTDRLAGAIELGRGAALAGERAERARALLAARRPSGPTDLPGVLEELVSAREERRSSARVVLLTDGRDQRALPSARGRIAVALERLSGAGAQLRVLAGGAEPDLDFLRAFERPELGSSVLRLGSDVSAALERATVEERWLEQARPVRVSASQAGAAVVEQREALAGAPAVVRTLRLRARDGDAVLLEDDETNVLAAARPAGSGVCAVLATLPGTLGSPDWERQSERWLPWVRALARGRVHSAMGASARWSAPRTLEFGPFEPTLGRSLRAYWCEGGAAERELALEQVPSAAFPAGTYLSAEVDARVTDGARVRLAPSEGALAEGALAEGNYMLAVPARCEEEYLQPPRTLRFGTSSPPPRSGSAGSWLGWSALVLGLVALTLGALLGLRGRTADAP